MDIFQPDDSLPDVELEWIEDDYSSGQKTLFHLLKEVIKRASALTSQQVAQRIDDLYPPNRSPEDQANEDANDTPGGYLWSIWEEFHWFATRIPYNHPAQDRLASVVAALRQIVGKTPQVFLESWNETYQLW